MEDEPVGAGLERPRRARRCARPSSVSCSGDELVAAIELDADAGRGPAALGVEDVGRDRASRRIFAPGPDGPARSPPRRRARGGRRARPPRRRRRAGRRDAGPRGRGPATGSAAPRELEPVGAPDREVGALARLERADVVAPEHRGAAARAEPQRLAGGQRLRAAAPARDEQRLLDLEEEVAALVRGRAVDAEPDAHARVEQVAHGRDARAEPQVRRRAVRDADAVSRRSVATSASREVDAVRAPDVPVEPAERVEVLDRRAAVELAAVRLLLDGLGEVRVQPRARAGARARPTRSSARRVTENGEHGATAIWTQPSSCSAGEPLGRRRARRRASRRASPAAARRRDSPRSIEPREATMRTPSSRAARISASSSPLAPAREDVVVVEHRRAAGERELGEPGARRRVLGLLVDRRPRPGRASCSQREEVRLLRPRAREGLVEVVVRVDEAGRDDGAAEVDTLVRLGRRAAAGGLDEPVRRRAPSRPRARCPRRPSSRRARWRGAVLTTLSGTSSKRSTSTRPRSVIFRLGITESARNDSVRNGVAPVQPSAARRVVARAALRDHVGERRVREQAGDGKRALREHARRPRRRRCRRRARPARATAASMSSSVRRRRRRCCARRARPSTRARRAAGRSRGRTRGRRGPVARCRSITAIFARSRSGSATAKPSTTVGSLDERLGHDLVGDEPDRADRASVARSREVVARDRRDAHRLAHPLRHVGPDDLADRPARLEHELGLEALEVRQDEQVGLVAGRDRAEVRRAGATCAGLSVAQHERVLGRDAERDRLRAPSR